MTAARFDIVLFDLGGVLIDFGGVEPMRKLSDIDSNEALWQRWLTCPWVQKFERGHCSGAEFAAGLVEEWGLAISPEEYLSAFRSWPASPFPGAAELVEEVRRHLPVGCLSNTNPLHWEEQFSRWTTLDALDFRFLSFEMGAVKPDQELFEKVAGLLPAPRDHVLFLDDNLINVDAANQAGFVSLHVRGVAEARGALVDAGILEM